VTRPFDKHLDSDEFDELVSSHGASVTDSGRISDQSLREAQRHVESCQDCSRKLQVHRSVQSEISNMGVPSNVPPSPDCVADGEWLNVAAGLLPEAKARELMKHAAQCGHCRPLLKNAAETLADEATASEETLLASLRSVRPEWQRSMASTLRRNVLDRRQKPWWRAMFRWPTPAYALVGIAAVAVVTWIGVRTLRPMSANELLAQAYSERRTIEVRIPGAKYAPLRSERSAIESNLDKPSALLGAEALIGENLQKRPDDSIWLGAKGRADLLDGNYESALKTLQRALETEPDNPQLLTDLGSAYFLRAEALSRAVDYGNAIEAFGKALTKAPDDRVALYNRALTCEKISLYTQAIDDWEHYLKVDPQGEWTDQARTKLQTIKEKMRKHSDAENEPLWNLSDFSTRSAAEIKVEVSRRGEEYLQQATRIWLVELQSHSHDGQSDRLKPLQILAGTLSALHSDDWLADMVASTINPEMVKGSSLLSQAIEADLTGDYDDGQAFARNAESEFRLAGSVPGALRSRVELVYALDRASQGQACLHEAAPLKKKLKLHRYTWMSVQTATEDAICMLITASSGDPRPEARSAMRLAKEAEYNNLYLRAWSNSISIDSVRGDLEKAWREGAEALDFYWKGTYPAVRSFQLCSELAFAAEDAGLLHTSLQLSREALAALSKVHNFPVEATEHYRIASLASEVGLTSEAEEHFRTADQVFASIPKSKTTRGFQVDAETWLASMEANRGNVEVAHDLLEKARPDLKLVPTLTVPLRFYTTEGVISLVRSEYDDAERALKAAILIAEAGATTMRTTRERILWDNEVRSAYRALTEIRIQHFADVRGSLELWEAYRAMPLQRQIDAGNAGKIEHIDFERLETDPLSFDSRLIERVRPTLHRSTSLSYEVTASGVIIWAFNDHILASAWSPIAESELENLARSFILQCSTPYSDRKVLDAYARRLYDLLVRPIRGSLESDRALLVELDEVLSGVPIEALTDENGTFVGEQFIIAKSPGIGFLERMREDQPLTSDSAALIVGPPALTSNSLGLPSLPDATMEARDIARVLSSSRLLIGPDATLAAVQSKIRGVEIFHFSGHALSGEDRSGLLLATAQSLPGAADGVATLLSTSNLDLSNAKELQLVVLAGCSTGLTARGSRLSPDNLVLPFMASGVPHVVASLWNVNSSATAMAMRSFYQYLLSGSSVATALRRAKAEIRRDPRTSHPYYWAGFTAFGRA
jgi:CHAT domain-containing protein/cytochrome c-type biogenesis protein CcmH/NrfG